MWTKTAKMTSLPPTSSQVIVHQSHLCHWQGIFFLIAKLTTVYRQKTQGFTPSALFEFH